MTQNWDIKECSPECSACGEAFGDKEDYMSELCVVEEGYDRSDFCKQCYDARNDEPRQARLSQWRGVFSICHDRPEDILEKASAESLLRKYMNSGDESKGNVIFVLAVMLERKKVLVERDIQDRNDGTTLIVFEHRTTRETFVVPDPQIDLDQLESVQAEVSAMLGGNDREQVVEPTNV